MSTRMPLPQENDNICFVCAATRAYEDPKAKNVVVFAKRSEGHFVHHVATSQLLVFIAVFPWKNDQLRDTWVFRRVYRVTVNINEMPPRAGPMNGSTLSCYRGFAERISVSPPFVPPPTNQSGVDCSS